MVTNTASVNSSPVVSILTITFVVLKLTHVVAWSWWWVLSPLWLSAAFVAFVVVVFVLVASVAWAAQRRA